MNDKQKKLKELIKKCVDDIEASAIDLIDENLGEIFNINLKVIERSCSLIRIHRRDIDMEDRRVCSRCGEYETCTLKFNSYYDKDRNEYLYCDDCHFLEEEEILPVGIVRGDRP